MGDFCKYWILVLSRALDVRGTWDTFQGLLAILGTAAALFVGFAKPENKPDMEAISVLGWAFIVVVVYRVLLKVPSDLFWEERAKSASADPQGNAIELAKLKLEEDRLDYDQRHDAFTVARGKAIFFNQRKRFTPRDSETDNQ